MHRTIDKSALDEMTDVDVHQSQAVRLTTRKMLLFDQWCASDEHTCLFRGKKDSARKCPSLVWMSISWDNNNNNSPERDREGAFIHGPHQAAATAGPATILEEMHEYWRFIEAFLQFDGLLPACPNKASALRLIT